MSEFVEFPKIARLSRECVITEKIDGTNAQVHVLSLRDWAELVEDSPHLQAQPTLYDGLVVMAGSRNRYLTLGADNFGFAAWVHAHAAELATLGEGRHYGEWWGSGIQRGYGLLKGEKRFSLFNVARWHQADKEPYISVSADQRQPPKSSSEAPPCCHVVPVLYRGLFTTNEAHAAVSRLQQFGSLASPGFLKPEGIVIYHTASGSYFKKTLEKDEEPKGRSGSARAVPAVESVA